MGKRHSKPVAAAPPVPQYEDIFKYKIINGVKITSIGCTGITRDEYDTERLTKAPFLYYNIRVQQFADLHKEVIRLLQELPIYNPESDEPPKTAPPPEPYRGIDVDPKRRLYGPVYMMVAYDIEARFINAYLYIPSMTKEGKKWPNYHFLGVAHRWMHRLLFNPAYFILRPQTSCGIRISDNRAFQMGCRTEDSYSCKQSNRMHKRMKLYKKKKNQDAYPAIYYRNYEIDLTTRSLRDYVHPNSLATLQLNILPSDINMFIGCRYMLVSPNNEYFYMLMPSFVSLFRATAKLPIPISCMGIPRSIPINTRYFSGMYNTTLILEDGHLVVSSAIRKDDDEEEKVRIKVVKGTKIPASCAMVLQNNGTLVVYDSNNEVVSDNIMDLEDWGDEYDPVKDRRERMINLIAYLKLIRLYKDIPDLDTLIASEGTPEDANPILNYDKLDAYDSKIDYVKRLEMLLDLLTKTGRLKPDDPNKYGFAVITDSDRQDKTTFEYSKYNAEFEPLPEQRNISNVFSSVKNIAKDVTNLLPIDKQLEKNVNEEDPEQDICGKVEYDDKKFEKCEDDLAKMERDAIKQADKNRFAIEQKYGAATYNNIDTIESSSLSDLENLKKQNLCGNVGVGPDGMPYSKETIDQFRRDNPDLCENENENEDEDMNLELDLKTPDISRKYKCPVPLREPYTMKHDMYCRLKSLQNSIRKKKRQLYVITDEIEDGEYRDRGIQIKYNKEVNNDDYNYQKDRQERIEATLEKLNQIRSFNQT